MKQPSVLLFRSTTTHPPLPTNTNCHPHQIPFRQPAITAPLNWAFGAATSAIQNSSSSVTKEFLLQQHQQQHSNLAVPSRSRKRSASEDVEEMDHEYQSNSRALSIGLPKRIRTGLGQAQAQIAEQHSSNRQSPNGPQNWAKEDEIDIGKALASLSKPELLNLIHGLMEKKPEVRPTIQSLLPTPTLETIILRLDEVESRLIQSIPNKRSNREEYVWNRVKLPLNGFVQDCLGWLKLNDQSPDPTNNENNRIHIQLSDQFNLLYRLSLSIRKVTSLLPGSDQRLNGNGDDLNRRSYDLLHSELIPRLFESWKRLVERIDRLMMSYGIILSEYLINKWFNQLDELTSKKVEVGGDEESCEDFLGLMELVRDEAKLRFGRLVGIWFNRLNFQSSTHNPNNNQPDHCHHFGFVNSIQTGFV
ncbi:hypothetical protein BY996DRAFT_4592258 [Phakopsora pachyrhizi]|nr:hypothetical protein BY996DRAFT_4592258 [Phakopsora pachyrhizi]